jgi:hypothetical protein
MAERLICPRCRQLVVIDRVAPERQFSSSDMLFAALFGVLITLLTIIPSRTDAICTQCGARWHAGPSPFSRWLNWTGLLLLVVLIAMFVGALIESKLPGDFGIFIAWCLRVVLVGTYVLVTWLDRKWAKERLERHDER